MSVGALPRCERAQHADRGGALVVIGAQRVVDLALAEAGRLGKADETIVLVTDRADASLRWAGNSMTTNGESISRHTTVISIVRHGKKAHVGSVRSSGGD